jgi:CheY-like chemotaxis protein
MDVKMPGMDGFETAELIRQRKRSAHTPIIFLTASESADAQVFKGYTLGAVDYLVKPIVSKVLWSKVAVFVDIFRQAEQIKRQAEAMRQLEQREFIRRERRSSVADESQYAFHHLLVRDVAYSQIPRSARAAKHLAAAEWIESLGRAEDHAETIAHHYLRALEFAAATGQTLPEIADRARVALRSAGDRAHSLGSSDSAARLYESALELWPADDVDRPYVLISYGRARSEANAEGDEALVEASSSLEARDPEAAAEAEVILADIFWRRGRHAESVRHQDRAEVLVGDARPSRRKAYVVAQLSRFHMLAFEPEESIRLGEEALAMVERLGLNDMRAAVLNTLGTTRGALGDPGGVDQIDEAIALSRGQEPYELVRALNNRAHLLVHTGNLAELRPTVEEMNAVGESLGSREWIRWALDKKVTLEYLSGNWDDGWSIVDALVREVDAGMQHYLAGPWRMMRGRIQLARGDTAAATEQALRGLAEARDAGDPQVVAPLLVWNARLLGARREAHALFDEFIETWIRLRTAAAGPPGAIADAAMTARTLTREQEFEDAANRNVGAERWVEAALAYVSGDFVRAADLYGAIGTLPDEAEARLRAAEQLIEAGRRTEGDAELHRALAFWRSVGATGFVREGEALLAASA